jgi:two-component system OmpR family response regulator
MSSAPLKLLFVDDDVVLVSMLKEYAEQENFEVSVANDGEAGVSMALSKHFDLVVLDVMMPKLNGIEALRRIRAENSVPVILLTARGEEIDRIIGLELEADDYVTKPCVPRELIARIRAILRRTKNHLPITIESSELTQGDLTLYLEQRRAVWKENDLDLTGAEFSLLEALARQAGKVVSKTQLSQDALSRPLSRFDRSVDVHICSIRQKLGKTPDGRSWIQTVRGSGYMLIRLQ